MSALTNIELLTRKLFKGGNNSRKGTIQGSTVIICKVNSWQNEIDFFIVYSTKIILCYLLCLKIWNMYIERTLNVHNATRKAVICKFSPTFIKWQVVNQMFSINTYTVNQNWEFHSEIHYNAKQGRTRNKQEILWLKQDYLVSIIFKLAVHLPEEWSF